MPGLTDDRPKAGPRTWLVRLGWLVAIWIASVATLGLAAWAMKGLMQLAGMR